MEIYIYIYKIIHAGLTNFPHFVVFSGSTQQFIGSCFCLCLYACIFKQVIEQPYMILVNAGFYIESQCYNQTHQQLFWNSREVI